MEIFEILICTSQYMPLQKKFANVFSFTDKRFGEERILELDSILHCAICSKVVLNGNMYEVAQLRLRIVLFSHIYLGAELKYPGTDQLFKALLVMNFSSSFSKKYVSNVSLAPIFAISCAEDTYFSAMHQLEF